MRVKLENEEAIFQKNHNPPETAMNFKVSHGFEIGIKFRGSADV